MKANEARKNAKEFDKKILAEKQHRELEAAKNKAIHDGKKDANAKLEGLYEDINEFSKQGCLYFVYGTRYENVVHGGTYLQAFADIISAKLIKDGYKVKYDIQSKFGSQQIGDINYIGARYIAHDLTITISWEDKNESE